MSTSDRLDEAYATAVLLSGVELGENVTIDGRGRYTVVGYEVSGQVVKLDDGKERFSVYSHRVRRILPKEGSSNG